MTRNTQEVANLRLERTDFIRAVRLGKNRFYFCLI